MTKKILLSLFILFGSYTSVAAYPNKTCAEDTALYGQDVFSIPNGYYFQYDASVYNINQTYDIWVAALDSTYTKLWLARSWNYSITPTDANGVSGSPSYHTCTDFIVPTNGSSYIVGENAIADRMCAYYDTTFKSVEWSMLCPLFPKVTTTPLTNPAIDVYCFNAANAGYIPSTCSLYPSFNGFYFSDTDIKSCGFCPSGSIFCDPASTYPICTPAPPPVDCAVTPNDPSCTAPPPVDCAVTPNDPSCTAPPPVDCAVTPNDPSCVVPVDCNLTPSDPVCIDSGFNGNLLVGSGYVSKGLGSFSAIYTKHLNTWSADFTSIATSVNSLNFTANAVFVPKCFTVFTQVFCFDFADWAWVWSLVSALFMTIAVFVSAFIIWGA